MVRQPPSPAPERVIQARVAHASTEVVGLWFEQTGVAVLEVLDQLLGEKDRSFNGTCRSTVKSSPELWADGVVPRPRRKT